ncbi:hypothetical protein M885DRAFT_448470 [Pelagophyceae sp. CCMP2097]|nr:hypothetical protein M885DRAFT_448470 [Pelagophyceae sp. CCMP2097]
MSRTVLVTGGNSGIGLALCELLVAEHGCEVILGARSLEKGNAAVASIVEKHPSAASRLTVLEVDVQDDVSCLKAAETVKATGVRLFALVNNAGVGLAHDSMTCDLVMNTNYKGPKRVTDAFADLLDERIVNVSSGVASAWLRDQNAETKALFTNPDLTLPALEASLAENVEKGNTGIGGGYGLSKAALSALTLIQAKSYPHLKVIAISPGFIATAMTVGYGAALTPAEGCKSTLKALFGDVTSGWYYGSDGLRSPWTCARDPGMPEYGGEADPDAKVYNK